MFILYIFGLYLTWLSTRKVLSMHFISVGLMLPAVAAADDDVKKIMCIAILFQGLGCYSYNIIRNIKSKKILDKYVGKELQSGLTHRSNLGTIILIIFTFSFLASSYYFSKVGISLFAEEVGLTRLLSRHEVSGSYAFQRIFRLVMPILCMIYFLMQFSSDQKKYYNKKYLIIMILSTLSFLLFTGIRGNVITFMLIPFAIMIGYMDAKETTRRQMLSIFVVVLIAFITVTSLMSPDLPLFDLFFLIVERLSGAATDGITYAVLIDIPSKGYYFGMTYIDDILSLFSKLGLNSYQVLNYSAYIASEILGTNYNGEQAAVTVYGEFYANFGVSGVIVFSYALGIFLQYTYIYIMKKPKTIIRLAFYAYLQAAFLMIIGGPTLPMMIDYSISIGLFYALINIVKNKKIVLF